MNKKLIIRETKKYVEKILGGESTGHDWWHAWRVWKLAEKISKKEGGDLFVIGLAAWLHDVVDWKFYKGNTKTGISQVRRYLKRLRVDKVIIENVCEIVKDISFKGAGVKDKMKIMEGKIVQDADRLDALGAIGIARVFALGANKGQEIHNPQIKPKSHRTFGEYRDTKTTSINHFYEKLLLLKDRLNTKTAKKIAIKRHQFLVRFLKEFLKEWGVRDL